MLYYMYVYAQKCEIIQTNLLEGVEMGGVGNRLLLFSHVLFSHISVLFDFSQMGFLW